MNDSKCGFQIEVGAVSDLDVSDDDDDDDSDLHISDMDEKLAKKYGLTGYKASTATQL